MMAFLLKNYQAVIGLVATIVLGTLLGIQKAETRHWHKQSDQFEALYHAEQVAHVKTELNYIDAAEKARAADAANVQRVKSEQKAIDDERSKSLEARLADARARNKRLRSQQGTNAPTDPGSPGEPPVSSVPDATGKPDEAACDRLPDGSLRDAKLCATEQAIQLDELIKWVKQQAGVEVSK